MQHNKKEKKKHILMTLFLATLYLSAFTFGESRDIYNPWSIINYLQTGKIDSYWTDSSSNGIGK